MTNSGALNELVERTVEGMGYEFVELERLARGLVRVTIDTTVRRRYFARRLRTCERPAHPSVYGGRYSLRAS